MRHDLRDGSREVAVYELSDKGRAEFRRLFEEALTEVRPTAPLAFQTALSMLPLVEPRRRDRRLLKQRLANLDRRGRGERREAAPTSSTSRRTSLAMMDYWERVGTVEREWLLRLLFRIERRRARLPRRADGLDPAADDPGHQMSDDRERYLALLRR